MPDESRDFSGEKIEMSQIDPWYLENLVCPVDRTRLSLEGGYLVSEQGRRYSVVDGVPVLLVASEAQTIGVANASIARALGRPEAVDGRAPELYLETLGINEREKLEVLRLYQSRMTSIDPVAAMLIGATCGNAYKDLIGNPNLTEYPIPSLSLKPARAGDGLLDIGCNWGRWSVAATRKGFSVVGIDPSLGAIMAARRIAEELKVDIKYLVADGRFLPFRDNQFDAVYSYSVLQHLSKDDVRKAISQVRRVLKAGGVAKIQMANKWGVRSIQHQARRRFREPKDFEVRYWTIPELKVTFGELIGQTAISVDCFFGLGWQWSDFRFLTWKFKSILMASEALRRLSSVVPPMQFAADSVFCTATKPLSAGDGGVPSMASG